MADAFQTCIDAMVAAGKADYAAANNEAPRKWFIELLGLSSTSDEALTELFDRTELDRKVTDALADAANSRRVELVEAHLKSTVIGAMERTVRLRMRSRLRLFAHEAARRKSHGADAGAVKYGFERFVQQAMSMGKDIA